MDICAAVDHDLVLAPGHISLVPTGFAMALPTGFEAQIRPRSGLAVKHGISIINAPGTIDADYRGEVKIALINLGQEPVTLKRGDRIAQMVIQQVCQARINVVKQLDDTDPQRRRLWAHGPMKMADSSEIGVSAEGTGRRLSVCVLASGSRGNATYISDGRTAILIDAGLSGVEIQRRMACKGLDSNNLDAILVSHEHADHIHGVGVLSRRFGLTVYINDGTRQASGKALGKLPEVVPLLMRACFCHRQSGHPPFFHFTRRRRPGGLHHFRAMVPKWAWPPIWESPAEW